MKKILLITIFFIIPFTLAQTPEIDLTHIGYGKSPQEVHIQLTNTGDTSLTNIEIFIDGKEYKTILIALPLGKAIEEILFLDPGEHLIEVKTPEGAHDSINITVPSTSQQRSISDLQQERLLFLTKNRIWIASAIVILIFVIVIWIITRKPRLY